MKAVKFLIQYDMACRKVIKQLESASSQNLIKWYREYEDGCPACIRRKNNIVVWINNVINLSNLQQNIGTTYKYTDILT